MQLQFGLKIPFHGKIYERKKTRVKKIMVNICRHNSNMNDVSALCFFVVITTEVKTICQKNCKLDQSLFNYEKYMVLKTVLNFKYIG